MSRQVKVLKNDKGEMLEVYSANCISCDKEMVFPKDKADKLEALVPFLKNKIEAGTPCVECAKQLASKGELSIFSEDEINILKTIAEKERKLYEEKNKNDIKNEKLDIKDFKGI